MRFVLVVALLLGAIRAARAAGDEPQGPPGEGEGEEGPSDHELVKAVENPLADLISVPFQNNINYQIGPLDRAQYTLNVQPVIPLHPSTDWLLIARIIAPFIYQPDVGNAVGGTWGLGDFNPTFFVSPARPGLLLWGVGPVFLFPTATQRTTGSGKWGAGPSAVGLLQTEHWTVGALVNNIWSFAGPDDRATVNQFLFQYFLNYNLPEAWYLTSSPVLNANWEASSGNTWLVPFGAGIGKIFRLGKQPLNGQVTAYYNVIAPDSPPSPTWQLRIQVAFLFPTAKPKKGEATSAGRGPPPGCPVVLAPP